MGKISQMPAAGALSGDELIEIVQNGSNKKLPVNSLASRGSDGLSGYQVAVQNGFVGTQNQWLQSLKGVKGDQGNTGLS